MRIRRIVSLTLLFAICGMFISSIVLYIMPQGRIAYWAGWKLWGLDKTQWADLHTNMGLLMVLAGALHIYYNWGPIKVYLKDRARKLRVFTPEFNFSLLLTAVFIAGTLDAWPPLVWIQKGEDRIKDAAAARLGEPPYGHAEQSPLQDFLHNVGLEPDAALANLAAEGVQVEDPGVTIGDLAAASCRSPRDLYLIMKGPGGDEPTGPLPLPQSLPMGSGRMTLEEFCSRYGRDAGQAVEVLEAAGWQARPGDTLWDISEANGRKTWDLVDVLRAGMD